MFVEAPYYNMSYLQYQPSPTTYNPSFEEKILQALERIKINDQDRDQILHSSMQSLAELKIQVDQSMAAFIREEESGLPR